jgi:hypothetical protein
MQRTTQIVDGHQKAREVIELSTKQVEQLIWIKNELLRLQEVYETVLTLSPALKRLIIDVNELTIHLLKLIEYTVLLAGQVQAYHRRSKYFNLEKTTKLLNQVEEARQVIINHIRYLVSYYNRLATLAGDISDTKNALIPDDVYKYTSTLKRFIDLELDRSRDELAALLKIGPEILMRLEDITRDSEHKHKQLYIDIQRVIARVVKCYIALAGQANITAEIAIHQSDDIIKEETAVDSYQRLQQRRADELNILVSKMEWAYNILNRFLLPNVKDYVPREAERFIRFFENNEKLLNNFTEFVTEVVEKTIDENPNKPQPVVIYKRDPILGKMEKLERNREIMLIIIDKLPHNMPVTYFGQTIQVREKSEFIIKFGVTYFSESPEATPIGYVQVFLPHQTLDVFDIPNANEIYVGKKVYISLNEEQTNRWREIILLSLMAVGMKYGVLPSKYLQRYLIQKLES